MSRSLRFGTALSAIALATMVGGCASPRKATNFGGRVESGKIGLAMKALAALQAKDYPTAISYAERAVDGSPRDAGFRALLGNAYFAAGRFASADAAYTDSLSLYPSQPQVVLKLALVQIGQGKHAEAVRLLSSARDFLGASDYGLALALAGQPHEAVAHLEAAAREQGADAQLRQNLALAHALSGNWTAARVIAEQDLAADQVDPRIQQWMAFATPAKVSDQVASLTGVTPVASDPGQPIRLALRGLETRTAEAAPAPEVIAQAAPTLAPAVPPEAAPQVAFTEPAPAPEPAPVAYVAPSEPAPAFVAAAPVEEPAPVVIAASQPVDADSVPFVTVKLPPARAASPAKRPPLRQAALRRANGNSTAVVQLGAYGSQGRVAAAWAEAARRYSSLRAYAPVSARFNSSKGLVYRLSVKGFASAREANALCASLRRSGGSCFVRSVAGDRPVQLASR